MKVLLVLMGMFLSVSSFAAGLSVVVETTHKKGIDKGLILVNEFHSLESIQGPSAIQIEINEFIHFVFTSLLEVRISEEGPTPYVKFQGKLQTPTQVVLKSFSDEQELDKSYSYSYQSDEGQLLEIKLTPIFR